MYLRRPRVFFDTLRRFLCILKGMFSVLRKMRITEVQIITSQEKLVSPYHGSSIELVLIGVEVRISESPLYIYWCDEKNRNSIFSDSYYTKFVVFLRATCFLGLRNEKLISFSDYCLFHY